MVDRLKAITEDFAERARAAGLKEASPSPAIALDTPPQLSKYTRNDNTIHTSRWEEVTPDVQGTLNRWAGHAGDRSGKQLFDEMFHEFFFVHELGHWLLIKAKHGTDAAYSRELEANRLALAYWREKDAPFAAALLGRFRRISEGLPDPVPAGQDPEGYFNSNYTRLGSSPDVYGWFQIHMISRAGAERPFPTFGESVRRLSHP